MWSWEAVSILAAVLAGCGVLADRILLDRQKGQLQLILTRWWCRLDETRIPNLPSLVSGWFLRLVTKIGGRDRYTTRGFLIAGIVSVLLTSAALLFGNLPGYDWQFAANQFVYRFSNMPKLVSLYLPNLFFDIVTISITVAIVRKIHRHGPFNAFGWIAIDITFAGLLAISCAAAAVGAIDILVLKQPPEVVVNFIAWWGGMLALCCPLNPNSSPAYAIDALYSMTTFIPTVLFMGFLVICGVAKVAARAGRVVSLHVLEKSTEGEPENLLVFGILGGFVGVLGLFAKAIHHFVSLSQSP